MAKLVLICYRNSESDPTFDKKVDLLAKRLTPDNISTPHPQCIIDNGIHIAVFNSTHVLPIVNTSVCMGTMIDADDNWWKPTESVPDGSYALFRSDHRLIELVTDVVASRTIWYVQTKEMFVASTSQRAIIFFLQDFVPNQTTHAWMLSSGTLGPGLSWDRRIKCLSGNARFFLDRLSWKIEIRKKPVNFRQLDLPYEEHAEMLKGAIQDTFDNLPIHVLDWLVTLSGGYDSRAILLFLIDKMNPQCITWGLRSSENKKNCDADIAKSLANFLQCAHEYQYTDLSDESTEILFNRFLTAGEGRIDAITAYMDGFRVWKTICQSDYQGIIRGDEAFGCMPVSNASEMYNNIGLILCSDYTKVNAMSQVTSHYNQNRPDFLKQRTSESLATWRDRLNMEFEIPFKFAALNDLKLSYVEVINPLLSTKIVEKVKTLPENLRTDKILFKQVIASMSPNIPFAKYNAIGTQRDILRTEGVVNFLSDEINTDYARIFFPDDLINLILNKIKMIIPRNYIFTNIKKTNNIKIKGRIMGKINKSLQRRVADYNLLALRIYITSKMNRLLHSDSIAIKKNLSSKG